MNFAIYQILYPGITVLPLYLSYLKNFSYFHPSPDIEPETSRTLSERCTTWPLGHGESWTIDNVILMVLWNLDGFMKFCIGNCISMVIWSQKCANMIFGSTTFLLLVIWSQKYANVIFVPSIFISVLIVWNTEWYLAKAQQNFLYSCQKCWEYPMVHFRVLS